MNTPENLSAAATRLYNILAASSGPKTKEQLEEGYNHAPIEEPKAIATVNSLIVKGMISKQEENGETIYSLSESPVETNSDGAHAGDGSVEGEDKVETNDANAEEQRIISLLEKHDKKISESQLFELYHKEQTPESGDEAAATEKIEQGLKELTDAGVIIKEGDTYSVKN